MNNIVEHYVNGTTNSYFTRTQCDVMKLKPINNNQFSEVLVANWNSLPTTLRYATDLTKFLKDLKTHLFSCAFVNNSIE